MATNNNEIRIADVISESIVDGPGIRFVIFTQGCPHHCEGCHNPLTHDFKGGKVVTIKDLINKMQNHPYMSGLTISGGEPFSQVESLLELLLAYKKLYPSKNIIVYTGYTFEELLAKESEHILQILDNIDYLIDGKFVKSLRDLTLQYRGSSNQRIIDVQKTLATYQESKEIKLKKFD